MNISCRHSNSHFAHHFVIYWLFFSLWIESLHNFTPKRNHLPDDKLIFFLQNWKGNGSQKKEQKLIFFTKLERQWKPKERAKFKFKCLLPWLQMIIYSNSKFKVTCKNAGTLGLIPNNNRLKFITLHSPFCLFIGGKILKLNGHP